MRKPELEEKAVFNPEEAILFYGLRRRKFNRLLKSGMSLPFLAFYGKRRLIIRSEYERYMRAHPQLQEELKNGTAPVPKKT